MTHTSPEASATAAALGRMVGVDFGERRIGIAVSEGRVAVPLTIIEHESRAADIARVAAVARERDATRVVVGLPLLFSGEEGEQAKRARRFGDALARVLDVPVVYHDERLSSSDAGVAADIAGGQPRRTHIDDRAAAIILQAYIDSAERPS